MPVASGFSQQQCSLAKAAIRQRVTPGRSTGLSGMGLAETLGISLDLFLYFRSLIFLFLLRMEIAAWYQPLGGGKSSPCYVQEHQLPDPACKRGGTLGCRVRQPLSKYTEHVPVGHSVRDARHGNSPVGPLAPFPGHQGSVVP